MIKDFFASIRKATQDARSTLATLKARDEELTRERDKLVYAPAAKADIKRLLQAWIDAAAMRQRDAIAAALAGFIRRPTTIPAKVTPETLSLLPSPDGLGGGQYGPPADLLLAGLLGVPVQAALLAAIDQMDWSTEGLPMDERARRVEKLEAELQQVRTEMDQLLKQAAEAGVDLNERDPVWN